MLHRTEGPIKNAVDEIFDPCFAEMQSVSDCGGATIDLQSGIAEISFGRGGWFSSGTTFRVFIQWREGGTGFVAYPFMVMDISQSSESEKVSDGRIKTTVVTRITGFKKCEDYGRSCDLPNPPWADSSRQSKVSVPKGKIESAFPHKYPGLGKTIPPVYPRIARESGWEGTVMVRVIVEADGTLTNVQVKESSGHQILDDAAIKAVKRWQFIPAKDGDIPVRSVVEIPINFSLSQPHERFSGATLDELKAKTKLMVSGSSPDGNPYWSRVWAKIDQEWIAPPANVHQGKVLEAILEFRLERTGIVKNLTIRKTSGNTYYDLAAKRAVLAASPLPGFPPDMTERYFTIQFQFTVNDP